MEKIDVWRITRECNKTNKLRNYKNTMAKLKLKMYNMDELKTFKGTSFIIYNASAQRKTRVLGSMPESSVTLHLSLDFGANSAADAAVTLGIAGSIHKVAPVSSMEELGQWIIELHTNPNYKNNIDTIVIDNMVAINDKTFSFVCNLPRYKKDMLTATDLLEDNSDKNAESKKMLPLYGDVQKMCKDLINQMMELKDVYNVVLIADEVVLNDPKLVDVPTMYPKINGPASTKPVASIFDEVYRTKFTEGEFDSETVMATKFTISSYTDPMTGTKFFSKTRNIKNMDYLKANEMPADFREIFKEIGYTCKKDRVKPEVVAK